MLWASRKIMVVSSAFESVSSPTMTFSQIHSARQAFPPVRWTLNPVREWLATPITFMPLSYPCPDNQVITTVHRKTIDEFSQKKRL